MYMSLSHRLLKCGILWPFDAFLFEIDGDVLLLVNGGDLLLLVMFCDELLNSEADGVAFLEVVPDISGVVCFDPDLKLEENFLFGG